MFGWVSCRIQCCSTVPHAAVPRERERILANIVSMMQVKADRGDQAHSEKSIEQLQKETAKAAQQEKK
jgi:hypothetical protein